uniref:Uncharacterized protein n=1 Tax=Rangifer tarandus platyrhynchus TaxID=3082113 RepID=A0ACB0FEJ4_RANTA|nr:unnamed protein product [Rangifer tarandus platyrhynchus]
MDLLPLLLLLLQARGARVRSSQRTYSAASAALPAGRRRGGEGGGDRPAAPGAAERGGDAGGTLGDHGTVHRASPRRPRTLGFLRSPGPRRRMRGREGVRGPCVEVALAGSCTPVSACIPLVRLHPPFGPPPPTPARSVFWWKPALGLQRL